MRRYRSLHWNADKHPEFDEWAMRQVNLSDSIRRLYYEREAGIPLTEGQLVNLIERVKKELGSAPLLPAAALAPLIMDSLPERPIPTEGELTEAKSNLRKSAKKFTNPDPVG